ncbi:MAG: tetratricopeptide repeat protein [Treponema sp.]|nr:tetratricopeptide repeat protein [Treponema sp.]
MLPEIFGQHFLYVIMDIDIKQNTMGVPHYSSPDQILLRKEYEKYSEIRYLIVNELKENIEHLITEIESNPVVSARIKNFHSYFSKYIRLLKNGQSEPLITDLMGVRIICPFLLDLPAAEGLIKQKYKITERDEKTHGTHKEFCYESIHLLIEIPQEIIKKHGHPGTDIIEIQIRTILQDAWAEVEHELVYKAEFNPFDEPMRRKLSAINASLSLADIIFQEIRDHQKKYSKEMGKRRETFFQKIEESTDSLLFTAEALKNNIEASFTEFEAENLDNIHSIDDLLVSALSAHNQNRFNEAISKYTRILELKPDNAICSIIYKHRAMANFACSQYEPAIEDFSSALVYDPQSYKAAYYRGVVRSVLKQYLPAIDDYTLSLTINPYQSFCLFRRGQAYYHIGDYPSALADCENSLALEPENRSASKFKNILHQKLKM